MGKIGRNQPCPCGSGLKYKKCCLVKPTSSALPEFFLSKDPSIKRTIDSRILLKKLKDFSRDTLPKKQKRRKQHYVPIWYQKGFLPEGQRTLYYLDLDPFQKLPDGRQIRLREIYNQGPGRCFYKEDLYTTKFFGIRNEEIEEFLFGQIDADGHEAVRSLVLNDFTGLSKYFQSLFVYMDAQKLRTPKGLDWIRSSYFQLSRIELMLEMQSLRMMHCTMWVEGVMEIVSAEDSDIKFIISDHPVTIYNPSCAPDSKMCEYPNDPPTAWKASQTIFPLDLNHCFILTNLEYARDPEGVDPLTSRTNPRSFAQTITRWDTVIRKRRLNPDEVCAINYIIKKKARKYIAAASSAWLYPERFLVSSEWQELYAVVLPPKDELWHFGGEIYVGGKDGSLAWYQDEFGRTHTSREDSDDPVRKFSIKKRNQILCNAILEIFGFSKGKEWDDFRKELTDDKIKELYGVVGSLWNPDTEIMNLIPKPDAALTAFYSGTNDPRVTPFTVSAYSLYTDKIIMLSPFLNPRVMKEEYSPFHSPSKYRNDTIKNVLFMLQIMPFIDADIIEMIPDPCDFDPYFRQRIYRMAEARMKGRGLSKEDFEYGKKLAQDDFKRSMLSLPPDILKQQIKKALPDLSDEQIEKVANYAQETLLADPLASLQPFEAGESGAQLQILRMSGNLEISLYLAQVTGSYVYTDVKHRWSDFQSSVLKRPGGDDNDPWSLVAQALDNVDFIIYPNADPRLVCQIKENGYFNELIALYRRILVATRTIKNMEEGYDEVKEIVSIIKNLNIESMYDQMDRAHEEFSRGNKESAPKYKLKLPIKHLIPANGLSLNTIVQILLTHGCNTSFWNAVPLGVFLDLQKMKAI